MADWSDRAVGVAVVPWDRLPRGSGALADVTVSGTQNLTDLTGYEATNDPECGYLNVHNLTIPAGATLTINRSCAWIRATGTVTINGTINGTGRGPGGASLNDYRQGGGHGGGRGLGNGGGSYAPGLDANGNPTAGNRIPGFGSALDTGDVLRSPLSGGGGGDAQDHGGNAGSTILLTARRIVIGAAGIIESNGSATGIGGSGAGGCVGLLADEVAIARATGYIANAGAGGLAGRSSEGHRELYYRTANPAVIAADWHLVRTWRGARRAVVRAGALDDVTIA